MEKRMISELIDREDVYMFDGSLGDVLEVVTALIAKYRASAYSERTIPAFFLYKSHLETDEEFAERSRAERARLNDKEQNERNLYALLKAKFGQD